MLNRIRFFSSARTEKAKVSFKRTRRIAVGLSTKILPHNFIELIDASIKHLQGKRFKIVPDFPTAGIARVGQKTQILFFTDLELVLPVLLL